MEIILGERRRILGLLVSEFPVTYEFAEAERLGDGKMIFATSAPEGSLISKTCHFSNGGTLGMKFPAEENSGIGENIGLIGKISLHINMNTTSRTIIIPIVIVVFFMVISFYSLTDPGVFWEYQGL